MPKARLVPLKVLCFGLVAVVVLQVARLAARRDPLAGVSIPVPASSEPVGAPDATPAGTNTSSAPVLLKTNLPPVVQARVTRITDSEVFGPMPKVAVMPLALLGIAGRDAFLRLPSGQTEILREGEEIAGIKLLRIGNNRVLIEQDGRKQELTMFSGFGSATLLPNEKENSQ